MRRRSGRATKRGHEDEDEDDERKPPARPTGSSRKEEEKKQRASPTPPSGNSGGDELNDESVRSDKRSRKKRKRQKDTPKHPMTAYNYFFRDQRQEMISTGELESQDGVARGGRASKSNRSKGKEMFALMGKTIAGRWKDISKEEAEKYRLLADEDMKRYRREMEEYEQKLGTNRARRRERRKSPPTAADAGPPAAARAPSVASAQSQPNRPSSPETGPSSSFWFTGHTNNQLEQQASVQNQVAATGREAVPTLENLNNLSNALSREASNVNNALNGGSHSSQFSHISQSWDFGERGVDPSARSTSNGATPLRNNNNAEAVAGAQEPLPAPNIHSLPALPAVGAAVSGQSNTSAQETYMQAAQWLHAATLAGRILSPPAAGSHIPPAVPPAQQQGNAAQQFPTVALTSFEGALIGSLGRAMSLLQQQQSLLMVQQHDTARQLQEQGTALRLLIEQRDLRQEAPQRQGQRVHVVARNNSDNGRRGEEEEEQQQQQSAQQGQQVSNNAQESSSTTSEEEEEIAQEAV